MVDAPDTLQVMGIEIERKFLVTDGTFRSLAKGLAYRQGYLAAQPACVVRVRTTAQRGYLTVKGLTTGISRTEFEYEIPLDDATAMLDTLCEKPLIEKKRYHIHQGGLIWEVDEFFGENQGLILAEVELSEQNRPLEKPDWIGREVSGDPKYYNSNLVRNPYKNWSRSCQSVSS